MIFWCIFFFLFASFVSADSVLKLTGSNFDEELKKHSFALVKFFAPWCGHCKQLAPHFIAASEELDKRSHPVKLAEVDCTVETDLCSKHEIRGYPTLHIFRDGQFSGAYEGGRTKDEIVRNVEKEISPVSKEITSLEEIVSLYDEMPLLVAYIESSNDQFLKTYLDLGKLIRNYVILCHSHTNLLNSEKNTLRLYRPKLLQTPKEKEFIELNNVLKVDELLDWVKKNGFGKVGYRSSSNDFFFPTTELVVLYSKYNLKSATKSVRYYRNRMLNAIKTCGEKCEKLTFAYSSVDEVGGELESFGLQDKTDSLLVTLVSQDGSKYALELDDIKNFGEFLNKYFNGLLKPYIKSEPIKDDSGPLKHLVGLNVNQVVNDTTKDVFIVFHALWCGHCQEFMPKLEKIAKALENEPNVIVAAINAVDNDIPKQFDVQGFPTSYFVKKDNIPIRYEGSRDVDKVIKYIAEKATDELKGFDRSGVPKKGEL